MSRVIRRVLQCHLSPCQRYRYLLHVILSGGDPSPGDPFAPPLTVILKNPSTADAKRGDPTTGKVEAWARHHGFDNVIYLNLFALRSPYPKAINTVTYTEAVGDEADQIIQAQLEKAQTIVIAWGNPNGIEPTRYQQRIAEIITILHNSQQRIHTVGDLTQHGHPRHGLQWRKEMELSN